MSNRIKERAGNETLKKMQEEKERSFLQSQVAGAGQLRSTGLCETANEALVRKINIRCDNSTGTAVVDTEVEDYAIEHSLDIFSAFIRTSRFGNKRIVGLRLNVEFEPTEEGDTK